MSGRILTNLKIKGGSVKALVCSDDLPELDQRKLECKPGELLEVEGEFYLGTDGVVNELELYAYNGLRGVKFFPGIEDMRAIVDAMPESFLDKEAWAEDHYYDMWNDSREDI